MTNVSPASFYGANQPEPFMKRLPTGDDVDPLWVKEDGVTFNGPFLGADSHQNH